MNISRIASFLRQEWAGVVIGLALLALAGLSVWMVASDFPYSTALKVTVKELTLNPSAFKDTYIRVEGEAVFVRQSMGSIYCRVANVYKLVPTEIVEYQLNAGGTTIQLFETRTDCFSIQLPPVMSTGHRKEYSGMWTQFPNSNAFYLSVSGVRELEK